MKKLFLILFCAILTSCFKEPKPIEKYQGKGYVVIENPFKWSSSRTALVLKNKDTIISVFVPPFDAKNLKIGDTLK